MSKEYFPHDYGARLSLRGIRKDFGLQGLGFYWCFVEILHEEGGYIIFVAIVVSTTDITVMTAFDWTVLGLAFFVFMFCAYAMYINGSGNGIRAGRKSETYLSAKKLYDDLKNEIIEKKMQGRLPEFCRYYVEEELRNTRNSILTEVGVDFSVYQER